MNAVKYIAFNALRSVTYFFHLRKNTTYFIDTQAKKQAKMSADRLVAKSPAFLAISRVLSSARPVQNWIKTRVSGVGVSLDASGCGFGRALRVGLSAASQVLAKPALRTFRCDPSRVRYSESRVSGLNRLRPSWPWNSHLSPNRDGRRRQIKTGTRQRSSAPTWMASPLIGFAKRPFRSGQTGRGSTTRGRHAGNKRGQDSMP